MTGWSETQEATEFLLLFCTSLSRITVVINVSLHFACVFIIVQNILLKLLFKPIIHFADILIFLHEFIILTIWFLQGQSKLLNHIDMFVKAYFVGQLFLFLLELFLLTAYFILILLNLRWLFACFLPCLLLVEAELLGL